MEENNDKIESKKVKFIISKNEMPLENEMIENVSLKRDNLIDNSQNINNKANKHKKILAFF